MADLTDAELEAIEARWTTYGHRLGCSRDPNECSCEPVVDEDISRLRAEVRRLRAVLVYLAERDDDVATDLWHDLDADARAHANAVSATMVWRLQPGASLNAGRGRTIAVNALVERECDTCGKVMRLHPPATQTTCSRCGDY